MDSQATNGQQERHGSSYCHSNQLACSHNMKFNLFSLTRLTNNKWNDERTERNCDEEWQKLGV